MANRVHSGAQSKPWKEAKATLESSSLLSGLLGDLMLPIRCMLPLLSHAVCAVKPCRDPGPTAEHCPGLLFQETFRAVWRWILLSQLLSMGIALVPGSG